MNDKRDKDILRLSAVSKLNGMCIQYNDMIKKSVRTIMFDDNMLLLLTTPMYSNKDLTNKLTEILDEYNRLYKEINNE